MTRSAAPTSKKTCSASTAPTATTTAAEPGGTLVNTSSGQIEVAPSALAEILGSMRRIHEKLQFDAEWLVTASTVAMLVLALLGVVMGLPRFSNTLSGWHKGIAWVGMPLIVLSPLTGLFLATSVSFASAPRSRRWGQTRQSDRSRAHCR
ncbi:MAG: PepSY domain-containing protein [Burkholderiales bacterium]